ncbi:MAG: DUF599 domain-containing protein [Gammaproteobacteria bacterium]|jgi:uncharacterized membrane protein|nr:hypothetical protein [Gammaproteobacteria bacterium]MDP6094971.1 DUF599 domain-containing protein [Gammaproteobacteria bacterium]HJO12181.1 DUF599 domain-containing protein [Gammaproteobacteria bacterium]
MELSTLDLLCFFWFLTCWVGYAVFARQAAKKTNSLSSVLYSFRKEWVQKLCDNGISEVDAELLASLEKQVSFFASTSLLILASLVTVLSTASEIFMNISSLSFVAVVSVEVIQLKLLLLILIFTYGFFTFTWAIRQYGFCFILFGSSFHSVKYYKEAKDYRAVTDQRNPKAMAKVLDRAAHSYNYGLRAYYFALAALTWFINGYLFAFACAVTVYVLYHREFKSSTLMALVDSRMPTDPDSSPPI